ncbi:MAG: DNA photolyase family protein [Sphingobacteriales bacterium JAD_PAG50586_3]|nr:MAG: DNA photolyase family protein [Sphingobacteriales bacterium JAD_PAG50586_3]
MEKKSVTIFWFRRDLRLNDNAGLYRALSKHTNVLPIFIFDKDILDKLEDKDDRRVEFIHQNLSIISKQLSINGSSISIFYSTPDEVFKQLLKEYTIDAVYTNDDYEPYGIQRDAKIKKLVEDENATFLSFKDQVIFEKDEILKSDGKPYTVYTPFSRKWKEKLNSFYLKPYPTEKYFNNLFKVEKPFAIPTLESMGFVASGYKFSAPIPDADIVKNYHATRDIPGIVGTTHMGLHLRFGTVSVRSLAAFAKDNNQTWLNELIWREFFMMILWHFPNVVGHAFKPQYDNIEWVNNEAHFAAWCEGRTGYPIVDAGMRELNETGFMHNRVRMVVASFLTKHLLIDWRWGEAYFARKLLDFDLSANNGNWQWAAGTGCDAAPYFRVFNPQLQTEKFDPKLEYVRRWVPEFDEPFVYPKPIVEHAWARNRALEVYKQGLAV